VLFVAESVQLVQPVDETVEGFWKLEGAVGWKLTFWRWNYFFNFRTPCIQNVNNTGTKYVRFMKQTAF